MEPRTGCTMDRLVLVVLATLLVNEVKVIAQGQPVVDSPWGKISGVKATLPTGQMIESFQAIPFALPPIGNRRFAKPEPHPGLAAGDVFNGAFFGVGCPQVAPQAQGLTSEDCLTLSVYRRTPNIGTSGVPVIAYIHGGNFEIGAAAVFRPVEFVARHDVIFVVIQYRIGILGFLSAGDDVISGNWGLHDQNLALRWVQANIRAFGGDPDAMTIYGQSAGSVSVGLQMLSPYSKGLFHRALMQSGSPLANWGVNPDPQLGFHKLAVATRCTVTQPYMLREWAFRSFFTSRRRSRRASNRAILSCLRDVPVEELLALQSFVVPVDSYAANRYTLWAPVVDGDFIPRHPRELLSDVDYLTQNDVIQRDVMMGVVVDERGYIENVRNAARSRTTGRPNVTEEEVARVEQTLHRDNFFGGNIRAYLTQVYGEEEFAASPSRLDAVVDVADLLYNVPIVDGKRKELETSDAFGDLYFNAPMVELAQGLARAKEKLRDVISSRRDVTITSHDVGSVYTFLLNHFPNYKANDVYKGMTHGDDIIYVFDETILGFPTRPDGFDEVDQAFSVILKNFIATFAVNGVPEVPLPGNGTVPEFTLDTEQYISLGPVPRIESYLFGKRVALWTELVPSLLHFTSPELVCHSSRYRRYYFPYWN